VQALKAEALRLSRDLALLEEELLAPAGTQLAVFVSIEIAADAAKAFELESLQVKLDGKLVASVLYSAAELQALRRGAVQRVFVGNLRSGSHNLEATLTGRDMAARDSTARADYKRSSSISFEKTPAARYIELRIKEAPPKAEPPKAAVPKDSATQQAPELEVKVWQ
jgi:hypothetical protein